MQACDSDDKSGDLPKSHASAQQDKADNNTEHQMEDRDQAPKGQVPKGRALHHTQSGRGSNSLDQIIPKPDRLKSADLDSRVALSGGRNPSSAGTDSQSAGRTESARGGTQSVGRLTPAAGGVTNDSSQACSSIHLSYGGEATAMARLADAAAAICSQEKALQAQKASQTGQPCCVNPYTQAEWCMGVPGQSSGSRQY